jgi:predicted nucleic acid-binding protein
MAERYSKIDIKQLIGKPIFFDANIILYLFGQTGNPKWEDAYSSIFGQLLKQKNQMLVDFIVIAEVINRAIKIEYEKYLQRNELKRDSLNFKNYRYSKDGQETLSTIYQLIDRRIIKRFSIVGKSYTASDIEQMLIVDYLDFTDKSIVSICRDNDYILLTNDKDFYHVDIPVLTANPSLLR